MTLVPRPPGKTVDGRWPGPFSRTATGPEPVSLPLAQQQPYLLRFEQPRQAEVILFLRRRAELAAVVQRPVEVR